MLTYLRTVTVGLRNSMFPFRSSHSSHPTSKTMYMGLKDSEPKPAPTPKGRKGLKTWRSLENMNGTIIPIRPDIGVATTVHTLSSAFASLVWWLGAPGKWSIMAVRLIAFAFVMLRAFIPVLIRYMTCPWTFKNVRYVPAVENGKSVGSIRHQLDIYCPRGTLQDNAEKNTTKHPVVIFVSGGAWIIGYKLWAFLMGTVFQDNNIIFISPDYRNFPQADADVMVDDISKAIRWTIDHVDHYGGDPRNITLMGQSAGAHISSIALFEAAEQEARGDRSEFSPKSLARWVGISGPYDITALIPEMHRRGLHRRILRRVFQGGNTANHSAVHRIHTMGKEALALLPPLALFHGTADRTCPSSQTLGLAAAIEARGLKLQQVKLYEGKSHTDPILEDPAAGSDPLMIDLLGLIYPVSDPDTKPVILPPMLPAWQVRLARWLNPF